MDVTWTLGRHTALLAGSAAVVSPTNGSLTFLVGPAVRFSWRRFSLDLGVQAAFGPSVRLGETDAFFTGVAVIPAPTLAFRYGFGGG